MPPLYWQNHGGIRVKAGYSVLANASTPSPLQGLDHPQPDELSSEQIRNIVQKLENTMLGELNFHSTVRRLDWMGSAVILGTVMFAMTLLMAV